MKALPYKFNITHSIVNYADFTVVSFHDGDYWGELYKVDVEVSSGDYFITLATRLDQISSELKEYHLRAEIEEIVSGLIYLQDTYGIIKKKLGKNKHYGSTNGTEENLQRRT